VALPDQAKLTLRIAPLEQTDQRVPVEMVVLRHGFPGSVARQARVYRTAAGVPRVWSLSPPFRSGRRSMNRAQFGDSGQRFAAKTGNRIDIVIPGLPDIVIETKS
ncbi:MAG: hypothetical protein ABI451_11370, partial [Dokdonella sp.]